MAAPVIDPVPDRDSAPYWTALAQGRLELQHCPTCGHWTWPPRPICSGCHSEGMAWEPVAGTGEVHSWIVTHQVYAPTFVELVPYTIVLVRLDEQDDILIPGPLVSDGSDVTEVRQGLRVRAVTERVDDSIGHLAWKPEA
jgi:uncharacterized OB-fold protein